MIDLERISVRYGRGASAVTALRDISLNIGAGELVAITGPSGSGKTTLMNIVGLLDQPSAGDYRFAGELVPSLTKAKVAALRNAAIGFVFQSFHLLPQFSVLDNVALPLVYRNISRSLRRLDAERELSRVGLGAFLHRRPTELSGGQRQRVAIARALVGQPRLILADEPTGNLDSESSRSIVELLFGLNEQLGVTVVIVTHDAGLADQCPRRIVIRDGVVDNDSTPGFVRREPQSCAVPA